MRKPGHSTRRRRAVSAARLMRARERNPPRFRRAPPKRETELGRRLRHSRTPAATRRVTLYFIGKFIVVYYIMQIADPYAASAAPSFPDRTPEPRP